MTPLTQRNVRKDVSLRRQFDQSGKHFDLSRLGTVPETAWKRLSVCCATNLSSLRFCPFMVGKIDFAATARPPSPVRTGTAATRVELINETQTPPAHLRGPVEVQSQIKRVQPVPAASSEFEAEATGMQLATDQMTEESCPHSDNDDRSMLSPASSLDSDLSDGDQHAYHDWHKGSAVDSYAQAASSEQQVSCCAQPAFSLSGKLCGVWHVILTLYFSSGLSAQTSCQMALCSGDRFGSWNMSPAAF